MVGGQWWWWWAAVLVVDSGGYSGRESDKEQGHLALNSKTDTNEMGIPSINQGIEIKEKNFKTH